MKIPNENLLAELVGSAHFGERLRCLPPYSANTPSARIQFTFDASSRYDYQIRENEGEGSLELSGYWTVKNNVPSVQPQNAQAMKFARLDYRIDWDGATLLMYPAKEGSRDPIPLRFEKHGAY